MDRVKKSQRGLRVSERQQANAIQSERSVISTGRGVDVHVVLTGIGEVSVCNGAVVSGVTGAVVAGWLVAVFVTAGVVATGSLAVNVMVTGPLVRTGSIAA